MTTYADVKFVSVRLPRPVAQAYHELQQQRRAKSRFQKPNNTL